jgi:hypothetical protein
MVQSFGKLNIKLLDHLKVFLWRDFFMAFYFSLRMISRLRSIKLSFTPLFYRFYMYYSLRSWSNLSRFSMK